MESKRSSSKKKYPSDSINISGKSKKSPENYSDQDSQKHVKTPTKHKIKRNSHQKPSNIFTEVKKSHSPRKKNVTSYPTAMETTHDAEYLLPVNSLHQEESLMSLDLSFQSQEDDSNAEINELSHIQASDRLAQRSVLKVSDSSSTGAFDDSFSSAKSSFRAHLTEHSSSANECDLTSDRPDAATLSASAIWDFDEASYASVSHDGKNKQATSFWSSRSSSGSSYASALTASLMSKSPISLSEIPLPPSPQRVVHINSFSNSTITSVISSHGKMTSTPLPSSPNESSCSSQEKEYFRKGARREKLFKPVFGKAMNSMVSQYSKYSSSSTNVRSHPKKRLSLSPSFVSKAPYPVKQSLEQKTSNVTRKVNFAQSKSLKSSHSVVKIPGISHVRNFSKSENCSGHSSDQTAVNFTGNIPSGVMQDQDRLLHEFKCPTISSHSLHVRAGSSRALNSTYCNHDDRVSASSPFNVKQFLEQRKSYGTESDRSMSELDCSSDRPFDVSNETKNHSRYGSLNDPASLHSEVYSVGFIDTHCHLDFLFNKTHHLGTLSEYMSKMNSMKSDLFKFPASYNGCVAVFCQPDTFHKTTWYGRLLGDDRVWAAFGCHPHFSASFGALEFYHLKKALEHPKVVALGEIGLDYSYKNSVDVSIQQVALKIQLALAVELNLPLVIHSRDAHDDTLQIIKRNVPANTRMHRHCFTETWKEAVEWLEAFPNCFIGLTNLVSQRCPRGKRLMDVVRRIPLERLLLETDAPYFTPDCVRAEGGYHAHPGHALHVAAEVARVKGLSVDEVLVATRRNTTAVYGI